MTLSRVLDFILEKKLKKKYFSVIKRFDK